MRYTYVDESPYDPGKFLIWFKNGVLPWEPVNGCRHVLGARLMGLSYADFLRYCRDIYGAEIRGKKCLYPTPYFNSAKDAEKLAAIFEERLAAILQN